VFSIGRIALEVYHKIQTLHCFDISVEMIKQAKFRLEKDYEERKLSNECQVDFSERVKFHLLSTDISLIASTSSDISSEGSFYDFIYS
jgi:hypothetical protein